MTLALSCQNIVKKFDGKTIIDNLNLDVQEGLIVTFLGGSGSGKTTMLRLITGLIDPNSGVIKIGTETVFANGRSIGPEHRAVDMVFQDYALWPHMSVARNLAFGLEAKKLPRAEIEKRVAYAIDATQLGHYRDRLPSMLSGGQQQRVAIARCLAARPKLILFDEPMSNLDAALREDVRSEIVRLVRAEGMTAIYVTHDQIEALAVSDQLAVMRAGAIEQFASPQEIYNNPKSAFVANFLGGFSLLPGKAAGGVFEHDRFSLRLASKETKGDCYLVIRPEDVRASKIHSSNQLGGTIINCAFMGRCWRVSMKISDVTLHLDWPKKLTPGTILKFCLPPERCRVVPRN